MKLDWDRSIKFNKRNQFPDTILDVESSLESSRDEEDNQESENENDPANRELITWKKNQPKTQKIADQAPELFLKDIDHPDAHFPNSYNILQCLTLRSAQDNFDLERYEVIGDCFLKLTTVMKIYLKFTNTNEGNMANLKSQRVSNSYLFKLAIKKKLYEYIVSINLEPKVNWIPLNLDPVKSIDEKHEKSIDERMKVSLSDKSLADVTEALIGCYLMHLGITGANLILQWLEFKVSNSEKYSDFVSPIELPNPILSPIPESLDFLSFEKFSKILNYKFNNIVYLYQAFTHPTYTKNRYTASYQK